MVEVFIQERSLSFEPGVHTDQIGVKPIIEFTVGHTPLQMVQLWVIIYC